MDFANLEAMDAFRRADDCDLDCGSFDIKIRPAAIHNEQFKNAVTRRALQAKKKSLVEDPATLTGSFEQDVELFVEQIIIGWGTRPMKDNDGADIPYSPDFMVQLFQTPKGKVLFGKIKMAATDDQLFVITEEDLKNSTAS